MVNSSRCSSGFIYPPRSCAGEVLPQIACFFIKLHDVFANARSEKAAFHGSLGRMSVVSRPRRAGRAPSIERAGSFSRGQSLPRLPRSYMLIPANESASSGASAAARQRHTPSRVYHKVNFTRGWKETLREVTGGWLLPGISSCISSGAMTCFNLALDRSDFFSCWYEDFF